MALAVRLPALEYRPMHTDEANQAYRAGLLMDQGVYRYDPDEHHGPTLYYFAWISARIAGHRAFADTTETTFRLVPVVFGTLLVLLLLPLRVGLGTAPILFAAVLTAVSPAFVFYSRYFVQEMMLVCFTLGALVCGWRYCRQPGLVWALGTGACLGLMHATKETCVIAYASMVAAACAAIAWRRYREGEVPDWRAYAVPRYLLPAAVLALAISVTFYSSFFTYARGPLDSILAYGGYIDRGTAPGIHNKPWYYYLQNLAFVQHGPGPWWSEGFILILAAVGMASAAFGKPGGSRHRGLLRFLLVYAVLMTAIYSAIAYKTPWTALSFHHALILLAGLGAATLFERCRAWPLRTLVAIVLLAGLAHLGRQAYLSNTLYRADPRNPYVYAHTSTAFMRLVQRIDDVAAVAPEGHEMLIKVFQPDKDYWPLPWYLRKYPNVGYWHVPPEDLDAPFIITAPELGPLLDEGLKDEYLVEIQGLRPAVLRLVYIRQDLWDRFMATRGVGRARQGRL